MDEEVNPDAGKIGGFGLWWLGGLFATLLTGIALGWWYDFTIIDPASDRYLDAVFLLAFVLTLASLAVAMMTMIPGAPTWRRGLNGVGFAAVGFLAPMIAAVPAMAVIEGAIRIPAGSTHASKVTLPIDSAYQIRGRGSHRTIRIWDPRIDLDISRKDYRFMQEHRAPGDDGADPDKVASDGWFCATVTIESAGDARRVLHAGAYSLPDGTVHLCPRESQEGSGGGAP